MSGYLFFVVFMIVVVFLQIKKVRSLNNSIKTLHLWVMFGLFSCYSLILSSSVRLTPATINNAFCAVYMLISFYQLEFMV